ncbi:T9SS type A sorting domain-containing protein [Patiriisocius sp. Uisw_017]|uniref:T9SS type A sorting domain-containing protein n=1 Tax=Patiriisocius sp. Uisw_017 TaxID=3230968 RepID=UPI0039EC7F3E
MYPNPAKSILNVDNTEHIKRIDIFDLTGRLIKHRNSDFKNIDVSDLSSGTFILKVRLDSNIILNNKLIIE